MNKRLLLLFLPFIFLFYSNHSFGQFNCDVNISDVNIDLTADPFYSDVYILNTQNNGPGYLCCNQTGNFACQSFTVTVNPQANAIRIKPIGLTSGTVNINMGNCSNPVSANTWICLASQTVTFSICSDNPGDVTLGFETMGPPSITQDANVTLGCDKAIIIQGLVSSSISAASISPNNPGDYNNLLDCNSGCQELIFYTPTPIAPGTITYEICGDVELPACNGNLNTYCDQITLTNVSPIVVSGIGMPQQVCSTQAIPNFTVSVTGGTGPYTYNWIGPGILPGQSPNSPTITNPSFGQYQLVVYDNTFCTAGPFFQNFIAIDPLSAGLDQSFCQPQGQIQLNEIPAANWSGGTGVFSDGGLNTIYTPSMGEMTAGVITLTMSGTNVCGTVNDNLDITFQSGLTITPTVVQPCFAASNGSITLAVSGGSGNYGYSWDYNLITTPSLSNIPFGTYTVTVTDQANGCVTTLPISVAQNPGPPFLVQLNTTPIGCNGANNGAISTGLVNGVSPYTFSWNNGSTQPALFGLSAGTYTVTVTDNNGCPATATENLTEPNAILLSSSVTPLTCNGGNNASIDITSSGGTGTLSFIWTPNGEVTEDLSGLGAGTYTVTATDLASCTQTLTVNIASPPAIVLNATPTNATCANINDGAIDLNATGGSGTLSYSWSPNNEVTQDLSGLSAGNYLVAVSDQVGCSALLNVQIQSPTPIVTNILGTNLTCNGYSDGSANVNTVGGTSPYTYAWSNGSLNPNITNLTPGTYTVTVTDDIGCTSTPNAITISQPAPLLPNVNATDVTCNGYQNGIITTNVTGGTAPYVYTWGNGANTTSIASLSPGVYNLSIVDNNGCLATANATISEPALLSVSLTSVHVLCANLSTGSASVVATGGTGSYTYNWSNGGQTSTITNLSSGTYNVAVTDANGCSALGVATVNPPPPFGALTSFTNVSCFGFNNGNASVLGYQGTSPYTYNWSTGGTSLGTGNTLNSLSPGTYDYTVTDANNCQTNGSITIAEPAILNVTTSQTNVACNNGSTGSIDATVSGGTAPYSYAWSNASNNDSISNLG
ncbi:MAG: hypothetical protein EBS09_11890, partial [Flavobacteriia bacterium]|nr:hypothetical protein [Flavobacteriia bacterium]